MEKVMARPFGHAIKVKAVAKDAPPVVKPVVEEQPVEPPKPAAAPAPPKIKKPKEPKRPKKLWDNHIEIATIQKSERLRIVVSACTRQGFRCISIREFYYALKHDEWRPGRDGILIPIISPLSRTRIPDPNNLPVLTRPMDELLPVLEKAKQVAETMELADPANEVWTKPNNKGDQ